jgi:hypothetical protein
MALRMRGTTRVYTPKPAPKPPPKPKDEKK